MEHQLLLLSLEFIEVKICVQHIFVWALLCTFNVHTLFKLKFGNWKFFPICVIIFNFTNNLFFLSKLSISGLSSFKNIYVYLFIHTIKTYIQLLCPLTTRTGGQSLLRDDFLILQVFLYAPYLSITRSIFHKWERFFKPPVIW